MVKRNIKPNDFIMQYAYTISKKDISRHYILKHRAVSEMKKHGIIEKNAGDKGNEGKNWIYETIRSPVSTRNERVILDILD